MKLETQTNPYVEAPPQIIGRFTLALDAGERLPLDLGAIYEVVNDRIDMDGQRAGRWAKTYGALSVNIALDNSPTSFNLDSVNDHQSSKTRAEISTVPLYKLSEQLTMEEQDGPTTYLLAADNQPVSTELALIQALHLVDTALVTEQYETGLLPVVRLIDEESIEKLRAMYPDMFIRLYGNVRGLADAPDVIGTVLPTTTLEISGVETQPLPTPNSSEKTIAKETRAKIELQSPKTEAAFIGITTAKRPHFGHACLTAKAIALCRSVVIELNDQGPRSEQAIAKLAQRFNISVDEAAQRASDGTFSIEELEEAYRKRSDIAAPSDIPTFSLTAANQYYRSLFARIMPLDTTVEMVANSDMRPYVENLQSTPAYQPLFGDSGMGVIKSGPEPAVLVETKGKPTSVGVIASLATAYNLELVDSPPPLTAKERKALAEGGLLLEQNSGCGVLIDGEVCSGTNGGAVLLEDLIDRLTQAGMDQSLLLPVIRRVMDSSYGLPGEQGSICPNFATKEALLKAFDEASAEMRPIADPFSVLKRPIQYENILKPLLREITEEVYVGMEPKGKISCLEVVNLLSSFPILKNKLSERLQVYVNELPEAANITVPRNFISDEDRQITSIMRSTSSAKFATFLAEQIEQDKQFASDFAQTTQLGKILGEMGYSIDKFPKILSQIAQAKGIYKTE